MSEPNATPTESDAKEPQSPQEILDTFPGSPTAEQIAAFKSQVPNGAVRGFSPDGKRLFLLRGITGIEMRELQKSIVANASEPEAEFKIIASCAAVVWTNTTRNGKLDQATLRASSAGLADSLFFHVEQLSDFFPPAQLMQMSFDL
jgi:hypothetical protein